MVAETTEIIPKPSKRRRKLSMSDAEQIGDLVVKYSLTEKEACLSLGLSPDQWYRWKDRKKLQAGFDQICTRIRAGQIQNALRTIGEHGDGLEYTVLNAAGEVVTLKKPGDWRAHAFRLERVLSPERFADRRTESAAPAPVVNVNVMLAVSDRIYGEQNSPLVVSKSASLNIIDAKTPQLIKNANE